MSLRSKFTEEQGELIDQLIHTWAEVPDWRLAQLLVNAGPEGACPHIFYMDDKQLLEGLKKIKAEYERSS